MNTTAEIMELAHEYADAASEEVYEDLYVETTRRAIRNAVNELVEQAKWAHHTPALLSEADAAADIAGVARPGAEPVAAQQRFRHPQKTMPDWSPWQLCKPATRPAWEVDSEGYEVEYRALYTAPPQASQPLTDEQIMALVDAHTYDDHGYDIWTDGRGLARAIEAAHGIGAAQKGKK